MVADDDALREDDELLTPREACAFIGGKKKPIDLSTLYRGVKDGRYHGPVHPSPGISRFIKRMLARDRARTAREGAE